MKVMKERNNEWKEKACILFHAINFLRLKYIQD